MSAKTATMASGDAEVHVLHDEERAFYALERLWRDCPLIPLDLGLPAPDARR